MCSFFMEEDEDRVRAGKGPDGGVRLTPRPAGTDGFSSQFSSGPDFRKFTENLHTADT